MNALNSKTIESDSDLQKLAFGVLKEYNLIPVKVSVIQSGSIKTVWKVETQSHMLCLKRLKQTYDRALFSVNAQIHIKKSGGKVPAIVPAANKQSIVQYNDQLFVLYEWIAGKDLNFLNASDLPSAVQGLAEFHIASKGYETVGSARISSKLGKWPEQYLSMQNKFTSWKDTAQSNASSSSHSSYLQHVDAITDIANRALEYLNKSSYASLTAPGSSSIVLCHQDYGKGNAISTDKGVFVLDLDGVTFDLPARDLRKIIGKLSENKGQWDVNTIHRVVELYCKTNPLPIEEKKVLYIDLLYPHWFYGLVKNQYLNNKALKPSEIEKIAKLERAKVPLLTSFIQSSK